MPHVKTILPSAARQSSDETADLAGNGYVISNHNRWSRIALDFHGLSSDTWCELSFQIEWNPQEQSWNAPDFAAVGVDFLTEDGSSIDFSYVPGLSKTQIEPHSCFVVGPVHQDQESLSRSKRVHCSFLIPSPARNATVTIRSWRNSQPFIVRDPKLSQVPQQALQGERLEAHRQASPLESRRIWRPLAVEPTWFKYALVPGHRLVVRGQILNGNLTSNGSLARIVFRRADGAPLPHPYPEIPVSPDIGAFIDIPVHRQTRRFTLDLVPPPQAVAVDIGFQLWKEGAAMELVTPLEVSLGEDLLLESISGDEPSSAADFLRQLIQRVEGHAQIGSLDTDARLLNRLLDREAIASPSAIHEKLKRVQHGEKTAVTGNQLDLGGFPAWTLPEEPEWLEDPFQSPAWRLQFQSLSWVLDLAKSSAPDGFVRALGLCLSWLRSNPWDAPKDPLSVHPLSAASRTEVLLQLLSMSMEPPREVSPQILIELLGASVRHTFALAEIISQNVFAHSVVQIHAACSLLAAAQAMPRIPLASYWKSVALVHLRDGFDQLVTPDGSSIEQSQHYRMEIISLGLILLHSQADNEIDELRSQLLPRLRGALRIAVAITDPSGSLPPFGDNPGVYHHASWLRRLVSGYGTALLKDKDLATELSYPVGYKVFTSPSARIIAARAYERNPNWKYFCASFSEQRHEHGHFDCTSFLYVAGGTRWITDAGGSSLTDSGAARQYLVSSRAHNVAIPDGRQQSAGFGWLETTASVEGASIFQIGTNVYGPEYAHHRTFICLDTLNAIAIFDKFTVAQKPVYFEGLLHFDADIAAAIVHSRMAIAFRKESRLRVIPRVIAGQFSGFNIENARKERSTPLQGFLSRPLGGLRPANVLTYGFSGHGSVCGGVILAIDDVGLKTISCLMATPAIRAILEKPSELTQEDTAS